MMLSQLKQKNKFNQMLKTSLLSGCLLAAFQTSAFAATIPVSSKTQRVTAYQGLALVTRKVELPSLSSGNHEILIMDLPVDLITDSLSVNGEGQAKLKIHHLQRKVSGLASRPVYLLQQRQLAKPRSISAI